jgi:predicted esterase
VRTLHIATSIHGRVLIDEAADANARGLLVGFHGYAQSAEDIVAELRSIPDVGGWRIVALEGLHRFYTRRDERVVASWMTRQDRDLAIAENLEYVGRAIDALGSLAPSWEHLIFAGFSQGAAMAYRAAILGRHPSAGVVALAGDIPPEVRSAERAWPPVLVGAGVRDAWFASKVEADAAFLASRGIPHEIVRFEGGHEWTDEFRQRAGEWLRQRLQHKMADRSRR